MCHIWLSFINGKKINRRKTETFIDLTNIIISESNDNPQNHIHIESIRKRYQSINYEHLIGNKHNKSNNNKQPENKEKFKKNHLKSTHFHFRIRKYFFFSVCKMSWIFTGVSAKKVTGFIGKIIFFSRGAKPKYFSWFKVNPSYRLHLKSIAMWFFLKCHRTIYVNHEYCIQIFRKNFKIWFLDTISIDNSACRHESFGYYQRISKSLRAMSQKCRNMQRIRSSATICLKRTLFVKLNCDNRCLAFLSFVGM